MLEPEKHRYRTARTKETLHQEAQSGTEHGNQDPRSRACLRLPPRTSGLGGLKDRWGGGGPGQDRLAEGSWLHAGLRLWGLALPAPSTGRLTTGSPGRS